MLERAAAVAVKCRCQHDIKLHTSGFKYFEFLLRMMNGFAPVPQDWANRTNTLWHGSPFMVQ